MLDQRLIPQTLMDIPSNSGYHHLRLRRSLYAPAEGGIWARLRLIESTGDRSQDMEMDWIHGSRFVIGRILVSVQALREFRQNLICWLDHPRDVTADLGLRYEEWSLSIAPSAELISSVDKPVFESVYRDSHTYTRFRFIVDQSCIRICAESLDWTEYVK